MPTVVRTLSIAALVGLVGPVVAEKGGTPAPLAQRAIVTADPSRASVVPVFQPAERAVNTWRDEAAKSLALTPDQQAAFRGADRPPAVARCVKLNNYWCIKKAGWNGEIAADGEGHVAFASAAEGAAVAALLLRRYYVDFGRHTALSIISRWAPALCDSSPTLSASRLMRRRLAPGGLGATLRGRWLASHARGFVTPVAGRASVVRRSVVAMRVPRLMPTPTIALGLGEPSRPVPSMTREALLRFGADGPPPRSMIGASTGIASADRLARCATDEARIARYAQMAAAGLKAQADGDLMLFDSEGHPTENLGRMMANMSRVEIGPFGATPALIAEGIRQAFSVGRNPGPT